MKKILGVGAGQKWIGSATLVKLQFLAQDVRQVRVFLLQYSYYIFISSGGLVRQLPVLFSWQIGHDYVYCLNYMESPIC